MLCDRRQQPLVLNDEVHQERVAQDRRGPSRIAGSPTDRKPGARFAGIARAGLDGMGPIACRCAPEVFADAIRRVNGGRPVLVDVHVVSGYSPSMAAGMTCAHDDTENTP